MGFSGGLVRVAGVVDLRRIAHLAGVALPTEPSMTSIAAVQAFIAKWEQNAQKESAASIEHFVDLYHILGVPTPNDSSSAPTSTASRSR
jgi:hypothetical protein